MTPDGDSPVGSDGGADVAGEDLSRPPDGPAATAAEWLDRLGVTHRHDPLTTSVVFVAALLLGNYAGWLLADLDVGFVAFAVGSLVATWVLYKQPSRRAVVVRAFRALAVLLVLTPIAIDLTFLVRAFEYGLANPLSFVTTPADLLYLVVFAVLAAVPWGLARWLDSR